MAYAAGTAHAGNAGTYNFGAPVPPMFKQVAAQKANRYTAAEFRR